MGDGERCDDADQRSDAGGRDEQAKQESQVIVAGEDVLDAQPDERPGGFQAAGFKLLGEGGLRRSRIENRLVEISVQPQRDEVLVIRMHDLVKRAVHLERGYVLGKHVADTQAGQRSGEH